MSDDEKELEVAEGFKGAGQQPGIEIWRIEDFEPVKQDEKTHGQFYNQDAYLVLKSTQLGKSSAMEYNLHFWLGSKCHADKQGAVAIRAVELDDFVLGGAAIQHREVMSYESKLFLSYFRSGLRYLDGGTESGFHHVDKDTYIKRLFQVKGKHTIRVGQVECNCGSLNQADTFVLDDGPNIFVWVGPKTYRKEKLGGVEFARRLRDEEKGGKAHIHIIEDDWSTNNSFFNALGSREKTIRASDPKADQEIIKRLDQDTLLYQVAENKSGNGKKWAEITEIAQKPLKQSMLDSENCYVLDSGHNALFLWTGKKCSNAFKKKVWTAANEFVDTRGYPDWVSITRVTDGGETSLFKQYFESWKAPGQVTAGVKQDQPKGNIAESDYSGAEGLDISSLHSTTERIQDWMPDDGSGHKQVWRVEYGQLVEVEERHYGIFFGGDSYVIKYTYNGDAPKYIIYFWQGLRSQTDDKGASAAFAVKLDNEVNGEAVQIRVVMNKEPKHFMKIFGGKLLIFKYGRQRSFKTVKDRDGFDSRSADMFHIRGEIPDETRAIQVDPRASSLNTNDVFIVDYQKKIFVWVGKNADENEKEMAKLMVQKATLHERTPVVVHEGEEDAPFWNALGGEEDYYKGPVDKRETQRAAPRLFHCSQASGRFTVDEIVAFTQQDLNDTDVMILDTYDEIFIWIGHDATEWEKQESMKTAHLYLECEPTGRTKDTTITVCVKQGFEPLQFTSCFQPWDKELWNNGQSFKEIMDEVGKENAGIALLEDEAEKYQATYTLEELQNQVPPPGVDVTKKEMYLSEEEFAQVFGMTKDAYTHVPQWKRLNMRKQHGLF